MKRGSKPWLCYLLTFKLRFIGKSALYASHLLLLLLSQHSSPSTVHSILTMMCRHRILFDYQIVTFSFPSLLPIFQDQHTHTNKSINPLSTTLLPEGRRDPDFVQWVQSQGCPWLSRNCCTFFAVSDTVDGHDRSRWVRCGCLHTLQKENKRCMKYLKDSITADWALLSKGEHHDQYPLKQEHHLSTLDDVLGLDDRFNAILCCSNRTIFSKILFQLLCTDQTSSRVLYSVLGIPH